MMKNVNGQYISESVREAVRGIAWESSDRLLIAVGLRPEGDPRHRRAGLTLTDWLELSTEDLPLTLDHIQDGLAIYTLPDGRKWDVGRGYIPLGGETR